MHKTQLSRALAIAAVVAVAGVANAETFDSPVHQAGDASTMTHGQPNMVTNNIGYPDPVGPLGMTVLPAPVVSSSSDTTVLGAPPSTTTTEIVTVYPSQVYVQPNINWNHYHAYPMVIDNGMASATGSSPIPDRAGDATTITNGVPNLLP